MAGTTRRVAVTGLGVISPVGLTASETWKSMVAGMGGVGKLTHFDPTGLPTQLAAEVKGFDETLVMDRREANRYDRFCKLGLAAAKEAVEASGLLSGNVDKTRIGTIVGTGIGGLSFLENQHKILIEKGAGRVSPFLVPAMILNMAGALISMRFGLKGPSEAPVSACASSAHALGDAARIIQRGEADAMVAGGTEACITPLCFAGFTNMKAMSRRNDEPEKASRPFDKDRDGFVMGEGAAILVLEEWEFAKARGAKILGELAGYGSSSDAYHITAPAPEGEGAARSMTLALKDAGMLPEEIGYINAHGTSTPLNDENETKAIKTVFGAHAKKLAVSSTKSMTGHLLGAAGALEAFASVMALREGLLPPTINHEVPSPDCDLDYVPKTARKAAVTAALSNSLGFGGHNVSLIFKKA